MSSWPSVVILQPGPGSPPRNHTGRTAFPNARARDSTGFPLELLGTSQTLSFRRSQWDLQKKSSSGVVTLCSAFVGVQNETRRVEATTACLTQWPKIITLPHLGPSPQAVPLGSKQAAHYQTASLKACPEGLRRPIGIQCWSRVTFGDTFVPPSSCKT